MRSLGRWSGRYEVKKMLANNNDMSRITLSSWKKKNEKRERKKERSASQSQAKNNDSRSPLCAVQAAATARKSPTYSPQHTFTASIIDLH